MDEENRWGNGLYNGAGQDGEEWRNMVKVGQGFHKL